MKIITHPTVTLLAKQVFLPHTEYKIPADGNDAVQLGAFAAKGCYDSFSPTGRANEANQRGVLEHLHGSVLEHITATVFIEGISRALSLESNRHRQLAVSQRSTRYTAEEDAAIVLEPFYANIWNRYDYSTNMLGGGEYYTKQYIEEGVLTEQEFTEQCLLSTFLHSCAKSIDAYQDQVVELMAMNPLKLEGFELRKWARGKARNLLPHALETRITYTGNMRAWRWFVEARSDRHAEAEIRRLADAVLTELRKDFALYFEDFHVTDVYDGIPVWTPTYRKV